MRKFIWLFLIFLLAGLPSSALTFNVVVVNTDINKVCQNYYCYPEVSEIVANNVIDEFNQHKKIHAPSISEVRKVLAEDKSLNQAVTSSLNKFAYNGSIDFVAFKSLGAKFSANSVLIISNSVPSDESDLKRSVWEILEFSSALGTTQQYSMETNAVLLDTVNDLVMWSGNYNKKLSDNNESFSAKKSSASFAKLSSIEAYCRDILAKTISERITLRFFPKTISPMVTTFKDGAQAGSVLRYESNNPTLKKKDLEFDMGDSYGEVIYGD